MSKQRKRTEKILKSLDDDQISEQNKYDEYDDNYKKSNSSSSDDDEDENKNNDDDNDEDKENAYEEEEDNNDDDDDYEEKDNEYEYEYEENNDDTESENEYSDIDDNESDKSSDNKYNKKKYNLQIIKSNDENNHSCYIKINDNHMNQHINNHSKQYKGHKNSKPSYNTSKSYKQNTSYHSQQYSNNFHNHSSYKNSPKSITPKNYYNKTDSKLSTQHINKSNHYKMYGKSNSSSSNDTKVVHNYIKGHSYNNYYKKNNYSYNFNNQNKNSHYHGSHYDEKLDPYSDIYSNIDCSSNLIADVDKSEGRKKIARQTCAIIQAGSYKVKRNNGTFSTVNISTQIKNCIKYTRVYKPNFFITRDPTTNLIPHKMCKIKTDRSSSYGVARKILMNDKSKKVCILNFASATKPGGGFIEGKNAQEESLCRQSALYASLYDKPEMYDAHNSDINHHYYSDYMIYSPDVPVIRDDINEELLSEKEMYTTSVITSAAPYLKKIKENSPNFESKYKKYYEKIVLDRCRKIIMLAIYKKTDVLVLGSYGCGVFENDQNVVFGSFKTVLIDEGYGRYLDLVSFPKMHLHSSSGSIFKKAFKGYLS